MWNRLRLLIFMAVIGLVAAVATPATAQLVDLW